MRLKVGLVILALAISAPIALIYANRARLRSEFLHEIELARKDGIPTTASEFAKTIPAYPPEQNAAPIYQLIKVDTKSFPKWHQLSYSVTFVPSNAVLKDAKDFLRQNESQLLLGEQAIKLPGCNFNRKWEDGFAVLMPEYAQQYMLAELFLLRGSISAREQDYSSSLKEISRVLTLAKHAGEEGFAIAAFVRENLESMSLTQLASWSLAYRNEPRFAQAMAKTLEGMGRPDLKRELRYELYCYVRGAEQASSSGGRAKYGFQNKSESEIANLSRIFVNRDQAKLDMVRALREYHNALSLPLEQRKPIIERTVLQRDSAMFALSEVFGSFVSEMAGDNIALSREPKFEAKMDRFRILLYALQQPSIPRAIDKAKLRKIAGEGQFEYSYDGRKISIKSASAPGQVTKLQIPPDATSRWR